MKKKIATAVSLVVLSTLALGTGVVLSHPEMKKAEAYSAASLPTTIDLNDTSPTNIRSYYSALNNLDASERQGTNLLKNLKNILKKDQRYFSYENGTDVWRIYEITDRDWVKSPASSTTYGTYDSESNKLINYAYGNSNTDSKNNPYVHALYINRNVNNETKAWGNHNQDQWGINREHVWPKAEGFDSDGAGGARGDPMHLMAGNGYANNIHSNYYYGYVKTSSSYTDCGSKYSNQTGNLRGTSKTLNSGTVFEPQDCDKGDIARAIFYMVARYNYLSGSDSDGIGTDNPNLALTQDLSDWSSTGYTSSTSRQGKMGILTDLLAWHKADPVDDFEKHRNNLLYTNYTNNRNPFIDFPEWVDYIWGTATYSGSTYQSYNNTPTGCAQPNSDTINGYNSGSSSIAVTGVSLNKNSLTLEEGKTETLVATITPNDATDQGITWSSDDYSIATVSNGIVTAVSEGSATITVTTDDGNKTATCNVTVTKASGGGEGGGGSGGDGEPHDATMNTGTNATTCTVNDKDGIKVGNSSNGGSMSITVPEGATKLELYAAAWKGVSGLALDITSNTSATCSPSSIELVADNGISVGSPFTLEGDEADFKRTFTLSNVASETTFTFTTSVAKRCAIWGAKYTIPAATPTTITASVNRAFYVGNIIKQSDITLVDDLGNEITDFEFEDYMFVYEDTGTGGYSSADKEFEISYNGMYTTLEVEVLRDWYDEPDTISDTYNAAAFMDAGVDNNKYTGKKTILGTEFQLSNVYVYNSQYISCSSSKTSAPGYFYNTEPLATPIVSIDKDSYSAVDPNIRVRTDGGDWVLYSEANFETTNYYYFKIDYTSLNISSYTNINSITVVRQGTETPTNVANYIMYEDVEGQCVDKLDKAITLFYNMSKGNRALFMTASLESYYVIYTARQRFEAWLLNQGKTITYDSNSDDYVVSSLRGTLITNTRVNDETMFVIVTIALVVAITLGAYIIIKKKKQKQ